MTLCLISPTVNQRHRREVRGLLSRERQADAGPTASQAETVLI